MIDTAPLHFTSEISAAHIATAVRFESRLRPRYFSLAHSGEPWFRLLRGSVPVLLTAPHATAAMRHGHWHGPDDGTGWLAYMLHRLAGASVLHTTRGSPSDPNYYDDNAFKAAVKHELAVRAPKIVLDVHGCHWSHPFDIDLGTMHGRSLLGQSEMLHRLRSALRAEGLSRLSDNRFPAARNATVTKWVADHGTPCVQLEVQSTWLHPQRDRNRAHRSARLLQGLSRYIKSFEP
ncbi:MAG: ketol-acid reductoisomerase [Gammaproteobacteria bacterium]|nr:ketol-acid reductoisomerase [Gammaproteobacteria bacterium]